MNKCNAVLWRICCIISDWQFWRCCVCGCLTPIRAGEEQMRTNIAYYFGCIGGTLVMLILKCFLMCQQLHSSLWCSSSQLVSPRCSHSSCVKVWQYSQTCSWSCPSSSLFTAYALGVSRGGGDLEWDHQTWTYSEFIGISLIITMHNAFTSAWMKFWASVISRKELNLQRIV